MRIWGKIWKNNHMLRDAIVEDYSKDTRTHKVFHAIDELCLKFDLAHPIWLESYQREFKRHSRVRFHQDAFVEEIEFDYLEIQVLEEDY